MSNPEVRKAKRRLDAARRRVERAHADIERSRKALVDALIDEVAARGDYEAIKSLHPSPRRDQ